MAQHATSHFISEIIITDLIKMERTLSINMSAGTSDAGIYFQVPISSPLQMLRLHEGICSVRRSSACVL